MNYFAHGIRYVDSPYFLAGTALPDLLSVIDRRVRMRRRQAELHVDSTDRMRAEIARGVIQHLDDDAAFHVCPAFLELQFQLAQLVREAVAEDDGHRPGFLGHILVEILLDASLIEQQPRRLDRYYEAVNSVDGEVLQDTVNAISRHPTYQLAELLPRFVSEQFLYDYLDDERLLYRLNQVMRRVGLEPLPESLRLQFPQARRAVYERTDELTPPWSVATEARSDDASPDMSRPKATE